MRAVQVEKAKGPLKLVEREMPEPGAGQVRIQVKACGICHSDSFAIESGFVYPRIPGHEVAGIIDKVGPEVTGWTKGQRVGVGWFGKNCGHCKSCRKGDFMTCSNLQITGLAFDGGYAEYMIAPKESLALIPDELSFVEAAPLMCAGVTTFNSLRNSGARAGDTVAILGIGGLGHLGVQFAARMGFRTVAIARGKEKGPLAQKLGAHLYIDSREKNAAEELKKLGGAKVILATVTDSKTIGSVVDGLSTSGKLIIVGVSQEPVEIMCRNLISPRSGIQGWPSGTSMDSEETLSFCALSQTRSMNEIFPLERAAEAYEHMMSGKARFRAVLKISD
jgi:D-arabinose 1-dehydrogenase-like Zn-dependent alcohol dehydrogenase